MPLAGRGHILITIKTNFNGALVLLGCDCSNGCPLIGLCFLTTEAAAHTAHFNRHRMARHAKRMGDQMLGFTWPLR